MAEKGASSSTNSIQPINEISRRIRNILRPPPKLSRVRTAVRRIELAHEPLVSRNSWLERLVCDRWLDPIQPTEI